MTRLILITLIGLLGSLSTYAQGTLNLKIKVLDTKGKTITNAEVLLRETSTKQVVKVRTNTQGTVQIKLNYGVKWNLFINGLDMEKVIKVPEYGEGSQSMTQTYNHVRALRLRKQTSDRSKLANTEQLFRKDFIAKKGYTYVQVQVVSRSRKPHPNKTVRVINHRLKQSFTAKTDASGIARFELKNSSNYDIDVETLLNASFIDIGIPKFSMKRVTIQYETSYAKEKMLGDTVIQDLGGRKDPTSDRGYQTITVHRDGAIAPNEAVYLHEIHGNKIYLSYTDENGTAEFLLPLGKKYMVFFNFQKDVDVIDLTKSRGFATGSMKLNYFPDPKLEFPEKFIPKPEELFLVDFENFLNKQYPKPQHPKKIKLFAKWAGKVNANSKEAVLEVGYTASSPDGTLPTNLSLILDVSGSMAGYYRIERLKESLVKLITSLSPEVNLSVITYESEMKVIFPHQKLGSKKNKLIAMIHKIEAGGGTDILEAMETGYNFIEKNLIVDGTNRIVLLTDGYDQNPVKELIAVQDKFSDKIECSTVGVGEDYNYALLKQLATNGKGMLHFVGNSEGFDSLFTTGMGILLNPTAVNASLEVEYNDKLIYKHLFGLKEKSRVDNSVDFFLPNIYSGANEVALVKFDLVKPDETIEKQPVLLRLKYFEKGKKKQKVIEEKAHLQWDPYTGQIELVAEAETKKLYCIAIMNQALKVMAESYAAGNSSEAKSTLESTKKQVKELYPKAKNKDISKLLKQLDKYIIVFKNLENKENLKKKKG